MVIMNAINILTEHIVNVIWRVRECNVLFHSHISGCVVLDGKRLNVTSGRRTGYKVGCGQLLGAWHPGGQISTRSIG